MKNRESASLSRQRKKEVIKIHHYWFSQLRIYTNFISLCLHDHDEQIYIFKTKLYQLYQFLLIILNIHVVHQICFTAITIT